MEQQQPEQEQSQPENQSPSKIQYTQIVKNLYDENFNKKVGQNSNKIQNADFINQAVQDILMQIRTGEHAISFFAKVQPREPDSSRVGLKLRRPGHTRLIASLPPGQAPFHARPALGHEAIRPDHGAEAAA